MVLALLILLVVFNKWLYKSYLNPIFLQSVVWLVYYIVLAINIDSYDVYLRNIHPFLVLQSVGFTLGGFLCTLFTRTRNIYEREKISPAAINNAFNNVHLLYPFVLIVILICIVMLIQEVGSFSIFSIMEFRDSLAEDDGKKMGSIGVVQMLVSVYVLAYIASLKKNAVPWYKTTILLVLFLYYTLLLGSKGQFVSFFTASLYLLVWQKKISKTSLGISALLFVGVMLLLFFLRAGGEEDSLEGGKLGELLLIYTVTSLPGLYLSTFAPSKAFGYYTFRVAYVWLNKFGFALPLAPVLSEFIFTPLPTNVFSYLAPYYNDFGLVGVFILPMVLGAAHNFLFFKANKGSLFFLIFSAMFLYPMVMQVFEENYFRQFTNWIYISLVIIVLTKLKLTSKEAAVEPAYA